jgi:hypothetical protein
MNLFDEIATTNRAYCAAMGLDGSQYEPKLSPEEAERAHQLQTFGSALGEFWSSGREKEKAA